MSDQIDGKRRDMLLHGRQPINAETPPDVLAGSDLTPLEAFYVRNHGPVPLVEPVAWRLRVDGLVERELELSLDQLREFEPRQIVATLQCAGNRRAGLIAVRDIPGEAPWGPGATGNATWTGVSLKDVLQAAGIRDDAEHVAFAGADLAAEAEPPQEFGASIPRRKALAEEVLLAWEMNGRNLPAVHGSPLRAVVPGYIGARSVKWLKRITARSEPSDNYYQARGYRLFPPDTDPAHAPPGSGVALGAIAVNSEILIPADGATVSAGAIAFTGYAFAGDDRRIVRVDVSDDGGGTWRQANLIDQPRPWAWRRWQVELTLDPGHHEIVARAWDSAAAAQPEHATYLWNPKGYVNNAWARIAISVV